MKAITIVNEKNNSIIVVSLQENKIIGIDTKAFILGPSSLGVENSNIVLTLSSAKQVENALYNLLKGENFERNHS